jgi:hypothetical protein
MINTFDFKLPLSSPAHLLSLTRFLVYAFISPLYNSHASRRPLAKICGFNLSYQILVKKILKMEAFLPSLLTSFSGTKQGNFNGYRGILNTSEEPEF